MQHEPEFQKTSFLSQTIIANLKSDWFEILGNYSDDKRMILNGFEFLIHKYSGKKRFYHNLKHIHSLLTLAEEFRRKIKDPECINLAIWYHDAVYQAERSDNETRSAELAVANLTELNFPEELIRKIEQMILATQNHCAEDLDFDDKLFLDFDLSILGAEKGIYKRYAAAIRQEYSFVPEVLYRYRRKMILENFLGRPELFFTEDMRLRFETKARDNMKNEIRELS